MPLQSGAMLTECELAYVTHGTLNPAGDNAVLLPTFYTGTHIRNEPLFGSGRAIDPARHFVVSINLVRQRLFVVAEQHPSPAGWPALSPCHPVRQRRLPVPPAH